MNKSGVRLLSRCLVLMLVLGILAFSIVSLDTEHTNTCLQKDCIVCFTIHFSQRIILVVVATIITLSIIKCFVYFFIAEEYEEEQNYCDGANTLVCKKVQFNE